MTWAAACRGQAGVQHLRDERLYRHTMALFLWFSRLPSLPHPLALPTPVSFSLQGFFAPTASHKEHVHTNYDIIGRISSLAGCCRGMSDSPESLDE